jgi:predicted transcriptional regulator/DNA-binding XRE family transcriptional regulator
MLSAIIGTRIRQRRRELGLTQAELARQVGISAPYLNLIEWNKRRIAGGLLRRVADALGLTLADLDDVSEQKLLQSLNEISLAPAFNEIGIERDRISELIGRFPGWAKTLAAVAKSEQDATARVASLSDRLSNDPFLNETVHRMLTRIASVRSASEILNDYPDVTDDHRDRFNSIIYEETIALSDIGEALSVYLDRSEDADRSITPIDEVEALFSARENRFEEIEDATRALSELLTETQPLSRRANAEALCEDKLGKFIEEFVNDQSEIETAAARKRAVRMLRNYAIGAVILPMEEFENEAKRQLFDIESLAEKFSAEVETVCHRLTALKSGASIPKFGYICSNAAGSIIEMLGVEGLNVPRYAPACPLWVLYRAQQSPETVIRQRTVFPSGARFVFVARARHVGQIGFGKPRHYVTDMLSIREEEVPLTVYAPDGFVSVEEVGPSCRTCPRFTCDHRVEDPLIE